MENRIILFSGDSLRQTRIFSCSSCLRIKWRIWIKVYNKIRIISSQEIPCDKRGQNANLVWGAQRQRCLTRTCSGAFRFVCLCKIYTVNVFLIYWRKDLFYILLKLFVLYIVERICPIYARHPGAPPLNPTPFREYFQEIKPNAFLPQLTKRCSNLISIICKLQLLGLEDGRCFLKINWQIE